MMLMKNDVNDIANTIYIMRSRLRLKVNKLNDNRFFGDSYLTLKTGL